MDIKTLDIPKAIKGHLLSLRDVELDGCSDKGQNGFVFFGEHSVLKQRVAIKYYFHGAGEHSEVQLVSNIDHPNLLKIQEAHTIDDGYARFMTREMRFGDLDEYILIRSIGVVVRNE